MTPLVLLLIGLSVKIKKRQFAQIISMLLLRAGIVVILGIALITAVQINVAQDRLLLLAFGLSACSFWPFAHIAAVDAQEKRVLNFKKTFNQNFAINILAVSFPLSVVLILGILSAGTLFASVKTMVLLAGILIVSGLIYPAFMLVVKKKTIAQIQSLDTETGDSYKLKRVSEN